MVTAVTLLVKPLTLRTIRLEVDSIPLTMVAAKAAPGSVGSEGALAGVPLAGLELAAVPPPGVAVACAQGR